MAHLASLDIRIGTKTNTGGLEKTDRAIRKTTASLNKMSQSTGLIGKLSQSIFRGFSFSALRDGFGNYLQFEKDLGAIHSRFFAITKDEQRAKEEFKYIQGVANETATDVKAMADSYSIFFSSTSKSLGKQGAREVFEDWAKVGRVLHLSEYQMERVTYALREMSSKGAIYSQDLRMQIGTHVPNAMGLAQQAAEEMGIKGTQWFETLQKKAKGNAKITAEFVRLFSKYAKEAYGTPEALKKAMKQPDALAQMIKNKGFEFAYKFSQAGGGYMIVKILEGVNKLIDKFDFDKITYVLGKIGIAVGKIAEYMPQIVSILLKILAMSVIHQLLQGVIKITKFFRMIGIRFARLSKLLGFGAKSGGKLAVKAGAKAGAKIGGKAVAIGIAQGIPIVDAIVDIALGIWMLLDIVKIFYSMWKKKNEDNFIYKKEYFGDTNLKTSTVKNALSAIAKRGVQTDEELQKQLRYFGVTELIPFVHLDEMHNIRVIIGEHDIPISHVETDTKVKDKKTGSWIKNLINRPKTPKGIQNVSSKEFQKYKK